MGNGSICELQMKSVPTTGTVRQFSVARDANGVPHIEAATWLDALSGLGYMHAVDRGTQLLFARSVASGCGAEEIAGTPELVETDRFFRRIGLHLSHDQEVRGMQSKTLAALSA